MKCGREGGGEWRGWKEEWEEVYTHACIDNSRILKASLLEQTFLCGIQIHNTQCCDRCSTGVVLYHLLEFYIPCLCLSDIYQIE